MKVWEEVLGVLVFLAFIAACLLFVLNLSAPPSRHTGFITQHATAAVGVSRQMSIARGFPPFRVRWPRATQPELVKVRCPQGTSSHRIGTQSAGNRQLRTRQFGKGLKWGVSSSGRATTVKPPRDARFDPGTPYP